MEKIQKKSVNNQIIDFARVNKYLSNIFDSNVHASRINSMSDAVLGVITTASLAISMIGFGLSIAKGTVTKHAVKQVDRLMSNKKFAVWSYFSHWVKEVVGSREEIIVAMDWTEFDKDNHSTLALHLTTKHGRSTPLLWKTYNKSKLKNNMVKYEKKILRRLKKLLPPHVKVTILADRGFGYVEFYQELKNLDFDFVIRFKNNVKVYSSKNEIRTDKEWLYANGRARRLEDAKVTASNCEPMPVVICVHDKDMKEDWCLVSSNKDLKTREIINLYSKRWMIEPSFRDQKDIRFGMGMHSIHISTPERRDRLLFISAIAIVFLTVLGAAGEAVGMDRMLKSNTIKRRTHSLFRQGMMWYELIPNMAEKHLEILMESFFNHLIERETTKDVLSFV